MRASKRLSAKAAGRRASPLPPAEVEQRLAEAGAHFNAGRLDAAARAYGEIEARNPGDLRAPYSLAIIDIRQGRPKQALARLKSVLSLDPGHFPARHNLGYVSQALGLWAEAAQAYGDAWALRPDALETGFSLAIAQAVLGRTDDAARTYRRLAADPAARPRALSRLAILDAKAITGAELDALRTAAADPAPRSDDRVGVLFALAEALEAQGLDEDAFAAFEAGNRLKHETLSRSPAPPRAVAAAHAETSRFIQGLFTADFLAANRPAAGGRELAPIFVVGMPRSGSTLIEQILSSHPSVQAMGETGALPDLLEAAYAGAGGRPDRSDFRRLAADYAKVLRAAGWKPTLRPVDKTLEDYLHVGAIALMFPRAVILHSVRDPVDTCLACWRQLFASGGETLYDLGQIGAEYIGYRRMMEHWSRVLPGRVIDVSLEALIADPEAQIRWLVTEACGLAWDPACLKFHETERAVGTASAAQVRRPIYATSLQRWRRYERHLGPLLDALGPYAP